MKSVLIIVLLILAGCVKGGSPDQYPIFHDVYFEFNASKELQFGDVEYSLELYQADDGMLREYGDSGEITWRKMPVMEESSGMDVSGYGTLFGPLTVAGNTPEKYKGQPMKSERYWLFRFKDDNMDTLYVESHNTIDSENIISLDGFILYYNGQLKTSYDTIPEGIENLDNLPGPYYFYEYGELVPKDEGFGETIPWIIKVPNQ